MIHSWRSKMLMSLSVLAVLTSTAAARPVRLWSFKELNETADLVIIGTAVSSADTKNHERPEAKADTLVSVDTTFAVDHVLKGEMKADTVIVRHSRYYDKMAEISTVDGPCFVEFNSKLKNRYLIFLKRAASGSYEPITGQYDPVNSFFLLKEYHITNERMAPEDNQKSNAER